MQDAGTIGEGHRPLRDKVVEELRRRIVDGAYAPGDRLTEDRLAEAFGVSRNPVREAIRVLEAEGFVVAQPRRSAVVATLSTEDVRDLFDVRLALEPLAARLAAERAGPAAAEALREITTAAEAAATAAQLDRVSELNTQFHATVCGYSGNVLLRSMSEKLHARLQWVYRQSAADRVNHSWAEHESLLAAIGAGDGDKAAAEATNHIRAAQAAALALAR
ncbi:MAG: FCD domain-containing protein [Micromonosporaceae bacterium]|nr:FCD domain-containing protein [Micromonosporaceae bacterium]